MKLKLRILNFFYFAISAFAIFAYVVNPILTTSLKLHLDADVLAETVDESLFDEYGIIIDDLFNEEEEIEFEVKVKVDHTLLLKSWQTANYKRFVNKEILEPVLEDELLEDLEPVLCSVARSAVTAMISYVVEADLGEMVPVGEDLYTKLYSTGGYTQADVQTSVGSIVDKIFEQGTPVTTLDDVCGVFAVEYNKYANALSAAEKLPSDLTLEIRGYLSEFGLVDRNNNMTDIYKSVKSILKRIALSKSDYDEDYFNDDDDYYDDEEEDELEAPNFAERLFKPLLASSSYDEIYEDPLEAVMMEVIDCYLQEKGRPLIFYSIRIMAIALVLFIATWAIKIFQCFICLFRKKPYVRLNILGVLNCTIQVAVALVSLFTMLLYNANSTVALSNIPLVHLLVEALPVGMIFKFETSALIPAGMVVVNLLFSIVYGAVKRKFKHDYRKQELEDSYEY